MQKNTHNWGSQPGRSATRKPRRKSDLVYLEKSKAFVYGYEVGIRPEMLLSPKVALFAEYRFEMLLTPFSGITTMSAWGA